MRYRTRRAAWSAWMWFWGLLLGMAWPAALPLSESDKTIAVFTWLAIAVPALGVYKLRKVKRRQVRARQVRAK